MMTAMARTKGAKDRGDRKFGARLAPELFYLDYLTQLYGETSFGDGRPGQRQHLTRATRELGMEGYYREQYRSALCRGEGEEQARRELDNFIKAIQRRRERYKTWEELEEVQERAYRELLKLWKQGQIPPRHPDMSEDELILWEKIDELLE
jgi:hypothetical protein